ncbi:sensor domain-containing phosphodiesterase [Ewingella americana]|nr:EAL domain-containing protein [Ewingella americana]
MTDFMNKFFSWREFSRQWWGLPVLCALVFINLASWLSPIVMLPEGRTYLIYMPLAVCVALLMVFDWRALPGIVLTMFIRYDLRIGAEMGTLLTLIYLFSLAAAWAGYRWQAGRRWSASFGLMRLPLSRVSWLVVFLSVLFVFVLQVVVELDLLPDYLGMVTRDFMTLRTLINLQAIMLGTLLSGHLWYLVLRVLRKPRYLRVLRAKLRNQRAPGVKAPELALWFMILICMVVMLCLRGISGPVAKILLSDYTLTLLLPVLLFGAMRYGYHFISIVWTVALVVLFNHYRGFISESGFIHNLVFVSALMLVFTLSLLMMSAISSRQRRLMQKTRDASLLDPIFGLPNLRAFNRDLSRYPRSLLCFIRVSEMDVLSRNYGMQLRIQFKQQLAIGLRPLLQPGEKVYHLPGYDLVLRMNCEETEEKLDRLQHYVDDFRLIWNGLPLHPRIGLAYCTIFPPVEHLHMLLGELSGIAEVSLTTGKPESNKSDHSQVQNEIKGKVDMLHNIQQALDEDRFLLMAQPISGVRGDSYHEVLIRMLDVDGDILMPDKFLPVVHEFGLAYQLDMWVLKHTLMFIHQYRDVLPSARFAVNFSPSTLCRPAFSSQFKALMSEYQVEPYQIVLEVTESHLLHNVKYADYSMRDLRNYGCRIAIDDFGTGYASYDRLKMIQADILKIDGSFVRNMLTDPLDAYIVQSICQVARMKHLSIVAEYVETEEQRQALRAQGVDYMQGYLIGKPEPLITLISHPDGSAK